VTATDAAAAAIVVILPPRERFRAGDAGAVALTVRDFVGASRWRERITVFGGEPEHFEEISYRHVPARLHWLLGRNLAYVLACAAAVRATAAMLIEVHNRVLLALRLKARFPGRKVSLHLHNDPWSMQGAKSLAERRRLLQELDAIYCVSQFVRERLLAGLDGVDSHHVHVIHNALRAAPAVDLARKKQQVVYAGRFIPEKGVLELAQALAQTLPRFPDWRAVFLGAWGFGHVAGRSDYEQQVYAALNDVATQVDFRGHVPQGVVMEVFAESAIALSPSTGVDAFNRAAIEAMDQGCATIVSTQGGLRELGGDAAIRVDPVSATTLAAALTRLMGDAGYRASVARACQARVHALFNLDEQVRRLDAVRASLLQGG